MQSVPITTYIASLNPTHGRVFSIHYMTSVTCNRLVVFSSTNKTYHHDITEILLKVALNTINLNLEAKCYVVNILLRYYYVTENYQ